MQLITLNYELQLEMLANRIRESDSERHEPEHAMACRSLMSPSRGPSGALDNWSVCQMMSSVCLTLDRRRIL